MALFAAFIQGANACEAYAYPEDGSWEDRLTCSTSTTTTEQVIRRNGSPALFESRDAAEDAARACHWSNQRFCAKPARGRIRAEGVIVTPPSTRWVSCQES